MSFLNRPLSLLGVLLLATPALAQIPPQAGRNPNTIPPPGSPSPSLRPGFPNSPATAPRPAGAPASAPGNAAAGGAGATGEKQAIKVEDAITDEGVELQFPNTPISEILLLYEDLTGLKIIRDANAEQATVSIETTGTLPKEKAILFIEKSLLLNGYAFAPAGDGMVKFLAVDAKKPITEGGAPLIESAMELPQTDQVVNYVILLKYLNAEDAKKAIEEVVTPLHSYGKITPIPNAKALVITENSNTIRAIITLMDKLDHKPAETIQKTYQLTRSDTEDIKSALDEILGNENKDSGGSGRTPSIPQNTPGSIPGQQPIQPTMPTGASTGTPGSSAEAAPAKIIPIARRNCLLVIGSQEQHDYIGKLIEELDGASEMRNFISRPLKYLAVDAAMQILSDAITRTEGDGEGGSSGTGGNTTGTNTQNNTQNRTNNNSGSSLFNNNSNSLSNNGLNSGFGSGNGLGGGLSGGFGGGGSNLQPLRQNNGPQSVLIGKTLLISDPVANSIFVSGQPEHLRVMEEILNELDHRPQQIIISALIGDYQISENRGFSLETAFRGRHTSGSGGFFGQVGSSSGLPSTTGANNAVTTFDPRSAIDAATAYASGNGLTFIGGVHTGLDLIAQMLEGDSNFKVISRPTVFTQNNQSASLTSGLSFPIASSTQSSLLGGVNNNSFLSNVQYQDIVLSLQIIPLINSEDELTLQVSQQNSERAGNTVIAGNNYPIISKQELNTIIACRNNSTVLLGGLVRSDENRTRTSVPIISAIPLLNKVMGSRQKDNSKRELLIFIQPRIVEGMNDLPPSLGDSVGASPFSDEAQAAFRQERLSQDRAKDPAAQVKPRMTQRLKSLLNRILVND